MDRGRPPQAFAHALRHGWDESERDELVHEATEYRDRLHAYLQSLREADVDLVRLDLRDGGCDVCEPYDGCVYTLLDATEGLTAPPPLPICPACRHSVNMLTPYFLQNAERTLEDLIDASVAFTPPPVS